MENSDEELKQALSLMKNALSLIDKSGTAHDIAAHLDLATVTLAERLSCSDRGDRSERETDRNVRMN